MEHNEYQTGTLEIVQLETDEFLWRWEGGEQIVISGAVLASDFVKRSTKKGEDEIFTLGPLKCKVEHEWPELDKYGVRIISRRATKQHAIERRIDRSVVLSGGDDDAE